MAVLEEWRDVVGFEGLYEVSSLGRVRSYHGGKVRYMKCSKDKDGYSYIGLSKNGSQKFCKVHRLVYTAFVGGIDEGRQIDHVNTIRDDNRLSNLRCVTPRENQFNSITRVRYLEAIKKRTSSEEWHQKNREAAKKRSENSHWLNNTREGVRRARAKAVLQIDVDTGEVIREWPCLRDIERELGIKHGSISAVCHGRQKTAGGYRWRLVLESCS